MNKIINTVIFIAMFFLTKEFIYCFYEDYNFIDIVLLSMKDFLYYKVSIFLLSMFLSMMAIFIIKPTSKIKEIVLNKLYYFLLLIVNVVLVNGLFCIFYKELYLELLIVNFIILVVVNTLSLFFIFSILRLKRKAEK